MCTGIQSFKRRIVLCTSFAVALGLATADTTAQEAEMSVLYTLASPNEQSGSEFGISVSGIDDVDGDGYPDAIIGTNNENRAYVFSGADGSVLRTLTSPVNEGWDQFGFAVAGAGDVDGDGRPDFVVGAPRADPGSSPDDAGRAYIFDNAGEFPLSLVSPNEQSGGLFGFSVSGIGDVNGDDLSDVIVGAIDEDPDSNSVNAGRAYVFSGSDGTLIHTLISPCGEQSDGHFGWSVCGTGDVDDDGVPDIIVGATGENPTPSETGPGRAYVFSGATGAVVYAFASPDMENGGGFGWSVSWTRDANGDGRADFIVGAPFDEPDWFIIDSGQVYVFCGATGDLLWPMADYPYSERWGYFGSSVSGADDLNDDGYSDVVVGAPDIDPFNCPEAAGAAYVLSGASGEMIWMLQSPNPEEFGRFGRSVSVIGNVSGDGLPEVLVGAMSEDPGASPNAAGRAYVLTPEMVLSGQHSISLLQLSWTLVPEPSRYWGYGAQNLPYFTPGFGPNYEHRLEILDPDVLSCEGTSGIGDPTANWIYLVIAVNASDQELCRSNRFGEQDLDCEIP